MPCTKHTSRCMGVYPCCHQNLLTILTAVHELLEQAKVHHWLAFGTLLGAVRSHKFIPWDEDIDIGILEDDFSKVISLAPRIRELGFIPKAPIVIDKHHSLWVSLSRQFNLEKRLRIPINSPVYLSEVNSLHVDLTVHGHDDKDVWDWEYPACRHSLEGVLDPDTVVFEGREYPCPANPQDVLNAYYGKDWQTPKIKKWQGDRARNPELLSTMKKYSVYKTEHDLRMNG